MAPLMMGLFAVSPKLVEILLTDKCNSCVPFLQIFCLIYMFYPIHTANLNAIKAMGRSDLVFKLEIIKKVIGVILLIITMNISVIVMAYSLLISSLLNQIINAYPNKNLLDYGYIRQIKDILPSIVIAVIMGIIIYLFNFVNLNDIIILILQVLVGAIIYILGAKLLKIDSFEYMWQYIKRI